MEEKLSFDLMGIQSCQRNRYPLLFVDKITEAIPGKSAKGIKNFTFNEWYFPAHFDDDPNVPGFVLVECLVQTFLMSFLCIEEYRGMETSFVSINNVKFKKKVVRLHEEEGPTKASLLNMAYPSQHLQCGEPP